MNPIRASLLVMLAVTLSGCKDPKWEAEVKWREDQVNAMETEIATRAKFLENDRKAFKSKEDEVKQQLDGILRREQEIRQYEQGVLQREKLLEEKKKQLDAQEAEVKKGLAKLEIKRKRGPVPATTAQRILVLDPAQDEVLFERNADLKGAIASTTKVLTAILIIEAGNLDQIVKIQDSDTRCAPVRIGLKAGQEYTRRDLLTALMVKSSNDIAQALARDNAGSVEAFVVKMNEKAKAMGSGDCLFINPNGLPPVDGQPAPYCSARDLASICEFADTLPDLRAMVRLKSYVFNKPDGKSVLLENTNRVLKSCDYCDGMKTGYTQAAGYCLVATGERGGKRRIIVVLNGTQGGVWKDAQALLDWALKA